MNKKNSVFIGTSLDGYIADKNGGIDWLDSIPNPNQDDMGYFAFTKNIDALVMGRTTFETVCSFDVPWPYENPVFVLSNSLTEIPESHQDKAYLLKGTTTEILQQIHHQGYMRLYIDGGATINNFLEADAIDELIISVLPVLLGGGVPLFTNHSKLLQFELIKTETYLNQIVQLHYERKR